MEQAKKRFTGHFTEEDTNILVKGQVSGPINRLFYMRAGNIAAFNHFRRKKIVANLVFPVEFTGVTTATG